MASLETSCRTDVGRRRAENQDSLLVSRVGNAHLLAVADGLGGHAAGAVASRVATIEMEQFLKANLTEDNPVAALKQAIAKANKEIYLLSRENPAYAGMGTTLVAAILLPERVWVANVGDSRAYLVGDAIEQVTKDHSLVQQLVDGNVITPDEAFGHPQKNIVTRTLGLDEEPNPDLYEDVELSGRVLLLCSDGLTDSLRDEEIRSLVVASANLDEACTRLVDLANEKGGADNISVVMARQPEQ